MDADDQTTDVSEARLAWLWTRELSADEDWSAMGLMEKVGGRMMVQRVLFLRCGGYPHCCMRYCRHRLRMMSCTSELRKQ